ncbi:HYC_CC_PP family protein [Polaribacter sp.]|uniref:HYC_CC_PP family protein n=1 Tax=Polaribacter sp. TaxID=1920175 RepID=UPI003F6BD212
MKAVFTKLSSIILAILVLFSTFSFAVEAHYCGDFLMDISITGDTENCGMKMEKKSFSKKKNCCKDEVITAEGQDELQQFNELKLNLDKQQFVTAFLISHQDLFVEKTTKNTFYKDFSPPDIPKDYQVLYQSFLI